MRVDICPSDDYDTRAALLAALAGVGATAEDPDAAGLGTGLNRFHTARGEVLTVFVDAWGVDLEGPDPLVNRVLAVLAGAE